MRILPSRARLAGAGLAVAAVTIAALGILILNELDRELELHRAVIVAQQVKDSLDKNGKATSRTVKAVATLVAELAKGVRGAKHKAKI